jgi:hypothetical protein
MISAYFTRQRFVSIERLPKTERFNSAFFTDTIFPSIVQFMSLSCSKMQPQGYWLHIDNAKSRNSALSLDKTEELEFTRLPKLLYSAHLALFGFFLFVYWRKKTPRDEFQIPKRDDLCGDSDFQRNRGSDALRTAWPGIERLHRCSTNGKDCVYVNASELICYLC